MEILFRSFLQQHIPANSALFLAVSFRYASVSAFFSIATDLSACIPVFSVFDEVSAFKTIVQFFQMFGQMKFVHQP